MNTTYKGPGRSPGTERHTIQLDGKTYNAIRTDRKGYPLRHSFKLLDGGYLLKVITPALMERLIVKLEAERESAIAAWT